MKFNAKYLLREMAMDLGDAPDWIDPQKKRKIERNQHPHADNPAFPTAKPPHRPGAPYKEDPNRRDTTQNYGELIGSHVYPEIIRKVHQYTGRDPRRTHPGELVQIMMQSMQQVLHLEQDHRQELEQAAVQVVLSLPEFSDAREAVEAGDLRLEATLLDPRAMAAKMKERLQRDAPVGPDEDPGERMQVDPDEETPDYKAELNLDVPEIRGEYDAEANKRKFVNLLIQGAAINKNYAYHQIADQLRAIDPGILDLYGKLQSISELMYWIAPEQQFNQMQASGEGGGMEEVTVEDDGIFTIRASAVCFPALIQELAKGLYDYLSHDEDASADVRKYAYGKADTLAGEQWDTMQGPGVWRHLNHLVNQANGTEYMGRIFRHLVTLPTGDFNELMQEILKETPRGRQYIQQVIGEIRAEEEGQRQESLAFRAIRQI